MLYSRNFLSEIDNTSDNTRIGDTRMTMCVIHEYFLNE